MAGSLGALKASVSERLSCDEKHAADLEVHPPGCTIPFGESDVWARPMVALWLNAPIVGWVPNSRKLG